jgi:hypothetical protein
MSLSPEDTNRLLQIRQSALAGTASLAELREGWELLRKGRVAASVAGTAARTAKAAAKAPVDTSAVLANLKALSAEGKL